MDKVPFFKYHGAGNDFILIDFSRSSPSFDLPAMTRFVCDRRHGIGADGLLLALPSTVAHYRMRIFNADGSEPAMCGNGIRCLVSYLLKYNNAPSEMTIETRDAILKCRAFENEIAVNLGVPQILHWPTELGEGVSYVVDTGVPHAVLFVDNLEEIDVDQLGRLIRFHPGFAPNGVNVNFVSVLPSGQVALRTYERGVEGETLACGTGAAAAAFVAMKVKNLPPLVSTLTRSSFESGPMGYKQNLRFHFSSDENGESSLEMRGPAVEVFQGLIDLRVVKFL